MFVLSWFILKHCKTGTDLAFIIEGDCLKTKEFTIRNRHSKIPIWDT